MTTKPITARTPDGVESQEWQVQYKLMTELRRIVKDQGVTHACIARQAGSSRSRVTAILNGNLDNVSSDLLIRLLGALGCRVRVSVSRLRRAA